MSLAVIIPTYNEKDNLPKITAIASLRCPLKICASSLLTTTAPTVPVRIADELVLQYPGKVEVIHRSGKLGLGTAYVTGFKHLLKTDVQKIAQMDADFSHPPEKLVEFEQALENADLVIGSRYIEGGSLDHDWPAWRKFLSRFGNEYSRFILSAKTQGHDRWLSSVEARSPQHHPPRPDPLQWLYLPGGNGLPRHQAGIQDQGNPHPLR